MQATDRALNAHSAVAVLRGAREHYYLCKNEARLAAALEACEPRGSAGSPRGLGIGR